MNYYELMSPYFSRGVLLDTNILVLLLVGHFNPQEISKFKRTSSYTHEDYKQLCKLLLNFKTIYTIPQILAETWNLVDSFGKNDFDSFVQKSIKTLTLFEENTVLKGDIFLEPSFKYMGVTDVALAKSARIHRLLVITDDLRASSHIQKMNVDVLNFNNIREFNE